MISHTYSVWPEQSTQEILRFNPPVQAQPAQSAAEILQFTLPSRAKRCVMSAIPFESAFDALQTHRIRSFFTMLGVIIGVGALIAVVTMTQSVNQAVSDRFATLGANILTILPGTTTYQGATSAAGSAQTLTVADAGALSQIPSVVNTSPVATLSEQIVYKNRNWRTSVSGVYPDYQIIQNWPTTKGNWFSEQDELVGAPVAVVGQAVMDNLFPAEGPDPIGQTIRINGSLFRIVGVLQMKGAQGALNSDDAIFVPFHAARERLNSTLRINQIQVQTANINDIDQVQQDISTLLRMRHALPVSDPALRQRQVAGSFLRDGGNNTAGAINADGAPSRTDIPDDFQILSINLLVQSAQQSAAQLALLLIGIACTSLAIGGIGIMNIMFVSVTERTREIGIRMAIGARRRDIRNQFLLEATILSTIGGIIGIILGLGTGVALILWLNLPFVLSVIPTLMAFVVSAGIGIASGLYPAVSAAKLDPVVAMRRE